MYLYSIKNLFHYIPLLCAVALTSCDKNSEVDPLPVDDSSLTLCVVNAGNYNFSNASLSLWNPENGVQEEVFYRANGFKLGDTAQSACAEGERTWIVVNNSNVVFAVDSHTMKEINRVTDDGLVYPRYFLPVSEGKAYISTMSGNGIAIVDTEKYEITGYIMIPAADGSLGSGATEEMVRIGDFVYANLWSYDNRIVKIDIKTDKVVAEVKTGIQPYSLVVDSDNNIWTLCDGGGWESNPVGYEAPSLLCIDPTDLTIKRSIYLEKGESVSKLAVNSDGKKIYWISNSIEWIPDPDEPHSIVLGKVCCRDLDKDITEIIVSTEDKNLYSLTVSPENGDIFVADAIDYTQPGVIYRYNSDGKLLSQFTAGVIPTSFTWIVR